MVDRIVVRAKDYFVDWRIALVIVDVIRKPIFPSAAVFSKLHICKFEDGSVQVHYCSCLHWRNIEEAESP